MEKKLSILLLIPALLLLLTGCTALDDTGLSIKSAIKGLPITVSTYDADGQKIDQIKAKSVDITTYAPMSKTDGNFNELSKVIDVEYGGNQMIHVGSSLIANEGLTNYRDEFSQHINIEDDNPSTPWLSRIYNNYKNDWSGKARVVMVRSQTGKPIAVFVGNKVRVSDTEMKSTTKLNIDGKRVFIYRCDYSIYDLDTVAQMK